MIALNVIVNAKYNKCLLVVVGNAFCYSFFSLLASAVYWSYVWSRLLLLIFVVLYFLFQLVQLCQGLLVGFFFSEIILDICELILSLLGIRVVTQCNDAIILGTGISSTPPFKGESNPGNSHTEKKAV